MFFSTKASSRSPAAAAALAEDRDFAEAVKRSGSGQLSVSIDDLSKTGSFKRDLDILKQIREQSQTSAPSRH